jgi:hypothetical protein
MKTLNGTSYHEDTSDEMMARLEKIRLAGTRVRFHWGDTLNGADWGDVYDVTGKLSRSTGIQKVLILIHNRRSTGGPAILDHCIVKITESKGGKVLYQHPTYFKKD